MYLRNGYADRLRVVNRFDVSSGNLKSRSRPACACGCGIPVSFDVKNDRWYRFYDGHKEATAKSIKIKDLIRSGDAQNELEKRLGLDPRTVRRAVKTLVELKFLTKRKVIERGRQTFELVRTDPPRFTPPVLKKKLKAMTILERDGFVESKQLTARERRVITDPLLTENPATAVTI